MKFYRNERIEEIAEYSCEAGRDVVRQINARADAPDEARSVNRYAAAILMPRAIIIEEAGIPWI